MKTIQKYGKNAPFSGNPIGPGSYEAKFAVKGPKYTFGLN